MISVLLLSWATLWAGLCANPTPASQIYSQLSIVVMSSGLSCKNNVRFLIFMTRNHSKFSFFIL